TINTQAEEAGVTKQVALLSPAWDSSETMLWNVSFAHLRERFGFGSRVVHYVHADDPTIINTIQQFDATFLMPPQEPTPEFAEQLLALRKPLVVLNGDWSPWG